MSIVRDAQQHLASSSINFSENVLTATQGLLQKRINEELSGNNRRPCCSRGRGSSFFLYKYRMEHIPILYEEPHFLLVNKPAALFSQAAAEIDSLQRRLTLQLKQRDAHPGEPFIGLPHRLDRGTSGIMLIARNQRALKRFNEQFQSRKVVKHYLAVVEGEYPHASQRWDDWLRKIPDVPKAEVVAADSAGAKQAVAQVTRLAVTEGLSLLLVQLETGRMHQIRIQASSRGFPVMGDAPYGAQQNWLSNLGKSEYEPNQQPQQPLSDEELDSELSSFSPHPPVALHAYSLQLRHPQTAKVIHQVASVPDNWQQLPQDLLASAVNVAVLPSSEGVSY